MTRCDPNGSPAAANFGLPDLATVTASGDQNPPRVTRTGYSGDGYFAESTTNPSGHIASQSIRARDGQPASGVDANGLRTRFEYDPFGRLTLTQHFGTTDGVVRAPDRAIAWTRCGSSCGANAKLLRTEVQDGSPTTATSLDVLGRTVRTTQRLLDGTQSVVDTRHDARGNVVSVSEPHRLGAPAFATRFSEHDALGRPRLKLTPQQAYDGAGELETRYRYDGRHTRIDVRGTNVDCTATPSKCLTLHRSADAFGRYHRTLDAESGRTRFWFDGAGKALAIEDAAGSVVSASYNALAQRTASNDPNRGRWTYTYNALGELLTQTDARGIVTQHRYDPLGRATHRDASGTALDADGDGARGDRVADIWIHDTVAIGQLTSASRRINGTPVSSEVYSYDAFARPDLVDRTIRTASGADALFRSETRYDAYYGRAKQLVHPTGDSVRLTYTKYGHLLRESSAANDAEFRRIAAVDGRGQPTAEVLGAGAIRVTLAYAAATGQMTAIAHHGPGNTRLRQIDYAHDVFGNVARQELAGGAVEAYEYDRLHRLKQSVRSNVSTGHATVEYGYDAVGNFQFKSDFSTNEDGAYTFGGGICGGGPNAVTSVQLHAASGGGTRRYCYDANGNLVGDSAGFAAVYDHDNLPVSIARGPTTRLAYGADGSRVRQVGADGARLYAGAYERIDAPALEHKVHLGDYAVITRPGTGSTRLEYLLKDRLGSVDAIADTLGRRREARGYDAFGKPREGTWADRPDAKIASTATTPKGFTQHEHLNAVKLIHMNGRAYDYELGRFLSVDPIIQFPTNSQSLNPYSYIVNNPLSGTDPTGYLVFLLPAVPLVAEAM